MIQVVGQSFWDIFFVCEYGLSFWDGGNKFYDGWMDWKRYTHHIRYLSLYLHMKNLRQHDAQNIILLIIDIVGLGRTCSVDPPTHTQGSLITPIIIIRRWFPWILEKEDDFPVDTFITCFHTMEAWGRNLCVPEALVVPPANCQPTKCSTGQWTSPTSGKNRRLVADKPIEFTKQPVTVTLLVCLFWDIMSAGHRQSTWGSWPPDKFYVE